jgi:catechol 2,3-dioxygenase-like lactoylglutathione lyase family enzyme
MEIQHVSIPRPPGMESRQQAQRFFGDLLGLQEKPVPQSIQQLDLVWFQVGDRELHVFAEEQVEDPSGRHFCLMVEDVEEMRARLTEAGYEPWSPENTPGRPRFFCRDPFGNIIEFTTITGNYLDYE